MKLVSPTSSSSSLIATTTALAMMMMIAVVANAQSSSAGTTTDEYSAKYCGQTFDNVNVTLTSDIYCDGDGISLVNGANLDCDEHAIYGPGDVAADETNDADGYHIGVKISDSDVPISISNCGIRGYSYYGDAGIWNQLSSEHVEIINVVANENYYGLYSESTTTIVSNSEFSGNLKVGMSFENGVSAQVTDSVASDNSGIGVKVKTGYNIFLSGITANNNGELESEISGVQVHHNPIGNAILMNIVANNNGRGLTVGGGNTIVQNVEANYNRNGIVVHSGGNHVFQDSIVANYNAEIGFSYLIGSGALTLKDAELNHNRDGIVIQGGSGQATIENVVALGNSDYGVYSDRDIWVFMRNTVCDNSAMDIEFDGDYSITYPYGIVCDICDDVPIKSKSACP